MKTGTVTATMYVGAKSKFGTFFCIFQPMCKKFDTKDDHKTVLSDTVSVVKTGAVTTVRTVHRAQPLFGVAHRLHLMPFGDGRCCIFRGVSAFYLHCRHGRTGGKSDMSKPHAILQTVLFGNQLVIVQRPLLSSYLHCHISNVKIPSPTALCNVYHFPCLLVSCFTKNTFSYFRSTFLPHSAVQQLCQLLLDPIN